MAVTAGRFELFIRQRLGALSRTLPPARAGDVTSVHQARVATRRLREALPLITRGSSLRKHRRRVRRLTRALGPVRELDVALLTLDEFDDRQGTAPSRSGRQQGTAPSRSGRQQGTAPSRSGRQGEVPRAGILSLQQAIRQERTRMQVDMRRTIDRTRLPKLSEKLVAAARKRDKESPGPRTVDPKQLAAARDRAARRAERLRIKIENAAAIYLADRLHEVRIAAKKLRYALEIVRDLSRSRATARILTLKRAQDLLGRIHDLEVLIARTRAIQGSPNAPTLRVSADMDLLVRRLETECRRLHGRYIAMRAPLLAICDHVSGVRPSRRGEPAA
jgi:CHAD domain-containing protein